MASFILPEENAAKILPPVRIIHGKDDRVCAYEGSVEFVKKMKSAGEKAGVAGWSADKEVDVWDGFQHVMHPYGFGGLDERQEAMVRFDFAFSFFVTPLTYSGPLFFL